MTKRPSDEQDLDKAGERLKQFEDARRAPTEALEKQSDSDAEVNQDEVKDQPHKRKRRNPDHEDPDR